jgi:hypothetical protein
LHFRQDIFQLTLFTGFERSLSCRLDAFLILKRLKYHPEPGGINMKKAHLPQNISTRREFLLGTASLALATVLPACSQTTKTVPIQTGRLSII